MGIRYLKDAPKRSEDEIPTPLRPPPPAEPITLKDLRGSEPCVICAGIATFTREGDDGSYQAVRCRACNGSGRMSRAQAEEMRAVLDARHRK